MKRCLRKVLGNAKLTLDELNTVLVEVEGTLNSRPFTDAFEEFEGKVLTPSHLICGRAIHFIPQKETVQGEISCRERFKYITLNLKHFWKRWKGEYLTGLREFHKCTNGGTSRKIQKGDVITVFGEREKRCNWKLAVVQELIVGKDKEIRGAVPQQLSQRETCMNDQDERLLKFPKQRQRRCLIHSAYESRWVGCCRFPAQIASPRSARQYFM